MSIKCQSNVDAIPILCQSVSNSNVNPVQSACQFISKPISVNSADPLPIRYLSKGNLPIQCLSDANQVPIHCNLMPIPYWSDVNPRPSWCQSDVNRANPMSIHCQSYSDLVSIQCQSCVDPTPFQSYQSSSTIQLIPNPQPIRCQFSVHPMPIQRQSRTNPAPI